MRKSQKEKTRAKPGAKAAKAARGVEAGGTSALGYGMADITIDGKAVTAHVREAGFVADSMKQAAAILNCDVGILKKAKRMGCPAFKGSRVWMDDLKDWLQSNPIDPEDPNSKEALERLRLKKQIERMDFEADRERGKFYDRQAVHSTVLQHASKARSVWVAIPNLAPQLVGRPVDQVQLMLQEAVDKGLEELRKNPL